MEFSNELTPAQLERLALLSEEMSEAQQAIGKIIRHGYYSRNPDIASSMNPDNRTKLETEMGHIFFALELLARNNDLSYVSVGDAKAKKSKSILPYLHYQFNQEGV